MKYVVFVLRDGICTIYTQTTDLDTAKKYAKKCGKNFLRIERQELKWTTTEIFTIIQKRGLTNLTPYDIIKKKEKGIENMRKINLWVDTSDDCELKTIEVEDNITDDEIDEICIHWMADYISWGWSED